VDYIFVRFNLTYLPANNLRRISTMYVRGYLQGSENGRVVTIDVLCACVSEGARYVCLNVAVEKRNISGV
jgi:hypothetical protein